MRPIVIAVLLITLIPTLSRADSGPALPDDVAKFVARRDLCDHFRGEEPYDAERRRFLEKNLSEYCTGTDRELAALKGKYRAHEAVIRKLGTYEETIEASSYEK